ncbi:MAG: hypothetical protein ACR2J5_14295 [Geodermatophilaceae bacterium]
MITVLQSFPRPGPQTNPYLTQLVASLPDDVVTLNWSWRTALLGRYDILHVHWPELLFRREQRIRTYAHRVMYLLLMVRVALTRIVIVRTVHNLSPHEEGGMFERMLLKCCDGQTALWIALNSSTELPVGRPSTVIPIGHYRDIYRDVSLPRPIPGRLLYFGLVRPYKGVLALISAFGGMDEPMLTLRILGRPNSEGLRAAIETACSQDPRTSAELRHVEDEYLAREIGESELVVLPYTRMHNSAAVLLALSLDRPVLAPHTPTTAALAEEVGPGWLLTYRGELDAATLRDGLARARSGRGSVRPDLTARDWPGLGAQHRSAFLAARTG